MRRYDFFSSRESSVAARSNHQARYRTILKRWRIPLSVAALIIAAVAVAQQAYQGQTEWFDFGTSASSSTATQNLNGSIAGIPDQTPVDLTVGLPAHDATVGKLAGEAGVVGGAATYSVPIVIPPGRRGMEPGVALSYSSRAGNGVAGMGWSLSASSSIHRCPATLDQDNMVRPVLLDASDKLCLDGQRLLVTAGQYGQAGATYATEIDSFARVTQLGGSLASTAVYFKVEAKSGEISYYGSTTTASHPARVVPGGGLYPLSWMLALRQDRVGNHVAYEYVSHGNGETLLSAIGYTGFGSTAGNRRVEFTYGDRPTTAANDVSSSYLAGTVTRQTKRLTLIRTKIASEAVREYRLAYQQSTTTGRSLLQSVTECGFDGASATCRPPTTFTMQQGAPAYTFRPLDIAVQGNGLDPAHVFSVREAVDYNGDGTVEAIWTQAGIGVPTAVYLISMDADRVVKPLFQLTGVLFPDHKADFDLDGKSDLVGMEGGTLKVWFWRGPDDAASFASGFSSSWSTGIGAAPEFVGDMDGDGRADVVTTENHAGGSSCARKIKVYRNRMVGSGAMATAAFDLMAEHCLASGQQGTSWESLARVEDFDGDGLPDIWVNHSGHGSSWGVSRVLFGRSSACQPATCYALQQVDLANLFPAGDPKRSNELGAPASTPTQPGDNHHIWLDINGDGLTDFLHNAGGWSWGGRLNQGGRFGPRIAIQNPNGRGLAMCSRHPSACSTWLSQYAQPFDYDHDGRQELLVPRQFAARLCKFNGWRPSHDPDGGTEPYFRCPEEVDGFNEGIGGVEGFPIIEIEYMYSEGLGEENRSKYYANALRFVEIGANHYRIDDIETSVVIGPRSHALDMMGDGLADLFVPYGCYSEPVGCQIATRDESGNPLPFASSPLTLPDGSPAGSDKLFITEGRGAGGVLNPDAMTPQTPDVMSRVIDGLGVQTLWTYYSLSSKAGRTSGDTPLYSVPTTAAARYVDDRHFYFTSSMLVVSDMIRSDGIGDYRSWRYGYGEAMYNSRGRGFQGFRTLIEEDEAAGTRTTTTFHQKFPLTSQPERIVVNSLNRAGTDGAISEQDFTWRCNRANRADAAACTPQSGAPTVRFPYLDTQETRTYDAATADNPGGGIPALVSYRQQVAADDSTCSGAFSTTSGYDAHGNLTASTVLSQDGTGSTGYRRFVTSHCARTRSVFAAPDTANWWLDKLQSRTVTAAIAYDAANHALPGGVSNPQQTLTTTYSWNANRTPATETLQPGIANQQRVTSYGYPVGNNYGLPAAASVAASGDPNGTRTVSTTYTPDGYFPLTVTNPLQHTVTSATRPQDGQPTQVTDANGLRTQFFYDAFGLPILTRFRGATDGEYLAPDKHVRASWCSDAGCVANGVYFVRTVQDGSPTNTTVFDRFSRPLRSRTRLLDDHDSITDTVYNTRGLVALQSAPYRDDAPAVYWTQFTGYDVLSRLTRKISPQPNQDGRGDLVTSYAYAGRQTAIEVCGSVPNSGSCLNLTRTTDSLGRYVETKDAGSGLTRFWYDGAGNALAIRDAKGTTITAVYNALGQRSSVLDPNQGAWSFAYNALGEVLSQTDARGITTNTSYDVLGRLGQRSATYDYDGVGGLDTVLDTWTYDPAYAKGAEASNERFLNGVSLRRETGTFDPLARPISRLITQRTTSNSPMSLAHDMSLTQATAYDTYYGRPKGQDFGNGEALWVEYSKYGDLLQERDAGSGATYRTVQAVDGFGNPTVETLAAGNLTATRTYHPQTGQVASIQYGSVGNPSLRRLDYAYDAFGNLKQQGLNGGQTTETYTFDALHRLTQATRQGAANETVTYAYDAVGNFQYKSDFNRTNNKMGWYAYTGGVCGGGPNAVKKVTLLDGTVRTYCYDANGNMTSDNSGLAMRYDHTQRPIRIARLGAVQQFDYGPDGSRLRRYGTDGETQYFPGIERKLGGEDKTYLGSSVLVNSVAGSRQVHYLLTDRLGSVDAVASAGGTLVETRGYDAFGKPRTGTWANLTPPRIGATTQTVTPHGYTGHEHLDSLELIHMNGRVYDYSLGRFTGVDPVIQFPLNSQSMNPYSYIMNNPLSGTDPTGYMYEERGKCKGRQSCEMQSNTLNDLQSEISSMAAGMGAGASSARVNARREARNGASRIGSTGSGSRQEQRAQASEKGLLATSSTGQSIATEMAYAPAEDIDGISPEKWGAIPHNSEASARKDLRDVEDAFWDMYENYQLPSGFNFLYDQEKVFNLQGYDGRVELRKYFGAYIYKDEIGKFKYRGGSVWYAKRADSPTHYNGDVAGPMTFYRGAMNGNRALDLEIYAHEVLHRNPDYAARYFKARNREQAQQVHDLMKIHLDELVERFNEQ